MDFNFFLLAKLKSTQILDLIYKGVFLFHEQQKFSKGEYQEVKRGKGGMDGNRMRKK